ncbi:hypothetical protein [Aureliella helgolandensis]|uniref:Uncharacterized protein n=1 Tax=Aureliella helgolandensis TaxID=2527968 RepID=A0A518G8V5_9BACT|nr:hypothetical protein [Aureliella helgolandensis]QDV25002.1 hypothetical protein Q31a_33240 [Aureliella helgolandensis]
MQRIGYVLAVMFLLVQAGLAQQSAAFQNPPPSAQTRTNPAVGSTENALQPIAPIAINGLPMGVLFAEIPLPTNGGDQIPRVLVNDTEGRVFYPVVNVRTVEITEEAPAAQFNVRRPGGLIDRLRSAIRGAPKKRQVPVAISITALYHGEGPIDLTIGGDIQRQLRITPSTPDLEAHRKLLGWWWDAYAAKAQQAVLGDDFPKLVHRYLVAMLSERFGLPAVDLDPPDPDQATTSQPMQTLALLSAIEPLREEILEQVLTPGALSVGEATLPVPVEPQWTVHNLPELDRPVSVEAIAARVPPECLYLRFGSFANYVWFQDLTARFGGDLAQAVLLRGFNYGANARMERMLATKMTTVAKMFGDKIIADMAIVGSDMYMKEGATLGVIMQSNNIGLLKGSMERDRQAAAANTEGATLAKLTIAGHDVSLLRTPDNRIRSFLVVDGEYLFITTSETLARRFIEVGQGAPALSQTLGFRWARAWMPVENDYSVFGYFSPEFFHHLVSPQYQIELRRRLEAIAHLEVAEVASQAALAEGIESNSLPELQQAGFLPGMVGPRADGAQTIRLGDKWVDSLRGARGSFLPIADVPLHGVTAEEARSYERLVDFYQQQWKHMDPMLLGLRRFKDPATPYETVAFEGYVAPFDAQKYGWVAQQLGPPTPIEIQLPRDDVASVQVHVRGDAGLAQAAEDYHLFAGLKDMLPPDPEDVQGLIKTVMALRAAPAYIGAWPKPGLIDRIPLAGALARPDYAGFSRMIGGLWRWQDGQFSLLSFNQSILAGAIPQLAVMEATDVAQARLHIANLQGTQISQWVNKKWFSRGWASSKGNTLLLDELHTQLKVPQEDCLSVAERLLDVKLQCPLGGTYGYIPVGNGQGWWESSAWQESGLDDRGRPSPPPGYSAPWIEWFRGCKLHVTQQPDSLAVVGTIQLEMPPLPSTPATDETPTMLPPMNFDIFQLPMQLFGGGKTESEAKPEKRSF